MGDEWLRSRQTRRGTAHAWSALAFALLTLRHRHGFERPLSGTKSNVWKWPMADPRERQLPGASPQTLIQLAGGLAEPSTDHSDAPQC